MNSILKSLWCEIQFYTPKLMKIGCYNSYIGNLNLPILLYLQAIKNLSDYIIKRYFKIRKNMFYKFLPTLYVKNKNRKICILSISIDLVQQLWFHLAELISLSVLEIPVHSTWRHLHNQLLINIRFIFNKILSNNYYGDISDQLTDICFVIICEKYGKKYKKLFKPYNHWRN